MRNSTDAKSPIACALAVLALVGCGSSSDGSSGAATAGSSNEASGGGATIGDGGASSLTDVDELCTIDCEIGNSAMATASCQSDDCQPALRRQVQQRRGGGGRRLSSRLPRCAAMRHDRTRDRLVLLQRHALSVGLVDLPALGLGGRWQRRVPDGPAQRELNPARAEGGSTAEPRDPSR